MSASARAAKSVVATSICAVLGWFGGGLLAAVVIHFTASHAFWNHEAITHFDRRGVFMIASMSLGALALALAGSREA